MSDIQLVQSNFTNIADQIESKAFVYISGCVMSLKIRHNYQLKFIRLAIVGKLDSLALKRGV